MRIVKRCAASVAGSALRGHEMTVLECLRPADGELVMQRDIPPLEFELG